MMHFGEHDFFFHIPRCGGNYTIRTLKGLRKDKSKVNISRVGHRHGSPLHCNRNIGRSFTTLRDPMSWYRSFYRFRIFKHYGKMQMEPGHPLDFYIWKEAGGDIFEFDYFLNRVARQYPWGYVTNLFCTFFPFVTTYLWLPELTKSLPLLLADWGYDSPIALPPIPKNSSPKDIEAECDKQTEDKILQSERGIINYLRRSNNHNNPYIFSMEVVK